MRTDELVTATLTKAVKEPANERTLRLRLTRPPRPLQGSGEVIVLTQVHVLEATLHDFLRNKMARVNVGYTRVNERPLI